MVSAPADDSSTDPPTDGGVAQRSDEELYAIVRVAAEDAVLGAFGTLILVGIGLVLVGTGTAGLMREVTPLSLLVYGPFTVGGAYFVLSSLRIIPPAREWL